jgi:GNAT superfamily N-acetyltransferase
VTYRTPEPLDKGHLLDSFGCGERALDDWLKNHALTSQASGSARAYVTTPQDSLQVVGYYALAASQVEPANATSRLARGQPSHRAIPVVLLARLAVDRDHQGRGIGRSLLRDALVRTIGAAESVGIRAMVVHAKGEAARQWYAKYGFEPSPSDPLHLILLLKDARATIERASESQPLDQPIG